MRMLARMRLSLHVHTCECFQQEVADHTPRASQQQRRCTSEDRHGFGMLALARRQTDVGQYLGYT